MHTDERGQKFCVQNDDLLVWGPVITRSHMYAMLVHTTLENRIGLLLALPPNTPLTCSCHLGMLAFNQANFRNSLMNFRRTLES